MQNSQLFQSYLQKKNSAIQSIKQHASPKHNRNFRHFQAVSEPATKQKENSQLYLKHLSHQFKETLRTYVHDDESFKTIIKDLFSLSQSIRKEKLSLENEVRNKQAEDDELQLQRQVLNDKNQKLLQRILTIQEQNKSTSIRNEQYIKIATHLEEDIEYQKCLNSQFVKKNKELVQNLQTKAAEIQQKTSTLQNLQNQGLKKDSQIRKYQQSIQNAYSTLSSQDNYLGNLCVLIQDYLQNQNKSINDVQYIKNDLVLLSQKVHQKQKNLTKEQEKYEDLKNAQEELYFQLRRVNMEIQVQEKGIQQEYWKVQQEKQRLIENSQYLSALQSYLSELINKNQMLQTSLQEQILQDHTIKKIVDSKCLQPVGKKTKEIFLVQDTSNYQQFQALTPEQSKQNFYDIQQTHLKERRVEQKNKRPKQIELYTPEFQQFTSKNHSKGKNYSLEDTKARTGFTYIDNLTLI